MKTVFVIFRNGHPLLALSGVTKDEVQKRMDKMHAELVEKNKNNPMAVATTFFHFEEVQHETH